MVEKRFMLNRELIKKKKVNNKEYLLTKQRDMLHTKLRPLIFFVYLLLILLFGDLSKTTNNKKVKILRILF